MTPGVLGPLMIDIEGRELSGLDRERLTHPLVGGVILFSRNYGDPQQLARLCAAIHALRQPCLPIAVDHEGGRVQRFREGFTPLPEMRRLGRLWDRDRPAAVAAARSVGFVLAAELRACGVDMSFAPVLDLDYGRSGVIGDRAFHSDAAAVVELAAALIDGLHAAGMVACGKHFPGHGWVEADSHLAVPVDERDYAAIAAADLLPYRKLAIDAVMPAHVVYPRVDARPAGFSPRWMAMLRSELGFGGAIFSDDLSMEGASVAGGIVARAEAAWSAGCDVLLVCNAPDAVATLLEQWKPQAEAERSRRAESLLPTLPAQSWRELQDDPRYRAGREAVLALSAGEPPAP
jgi:beta-N-acetylhexosaminidase